MKTLLLRNGMLIILVCVVAGSALAQRGPGGRGPGRGKGGHGQGQGHDRDHVDFRYLLTNHKKIKREVRELPNGVQTLTESDDPQVAAKIREHVYWMKERVEKQQPIRMRDPLFAELFKHAGQIKMVTENTPTGVRVLETSENPYVVKLIKEHAKTVSEFAKRGFPEAMKNHPVPTTKNEVKNREYIHPAIQQYGKVVQLPAAAQQPRADSKICVDLTKGGAVDQLNPSIEKIARYINIYQGAGKSPASVQIAVVLHGDATLCALNDDAYAERFKTKSNPNLECLHELHEAGVAIYVCGQSLIGKGSQPEEVVVFADVAVSALTSLVNLQTDGYAYVPLLK
ncbi:DsrE family protein [Gimesia algae]|uniref:DsrE/DsrF-like family protein n=1 Tax=Gimesia algae TaxID=2527971 RepID=A0A517V768_9PLAN|nr:DsrE family protein [Gimesia algae]QDT88847.1 DsrE/DsrF-like family protein [Gimesia algae]